jgi:hypothetical protein
LSFSASEFVLFIVPFTLTVLAIALDVVSRRGYSLLGTLALGTLVLAFCAYGAFSQAAQSILADPADDLEIIAYALFYVVVELGLALALTLCALFVTAAARHWWWVGMVIVVSVGPALLIFKSSPTLLTNLLDALGLPPGAFGLAFVLPPVVVTCAYAISQDLRWPLARSRARARDLSARAEGAE